MEIREEDIMPEYVVALTTCPKDTSNELGEYLVKERVCACVNIVPQVTSIYHWKGKIVTDEESLLIIKTKEKHKERLWTAIKEKHPYDVPELVLLPIQWGSSEYLKWISTSVDTIA